ncbi:MAG: TIGR02757 family protein [Ignavibacterium sp.]|nr:MAG: TIGR02757 family protein [Ignavibacterium sp.]
MNLKKKLNYHYKAFNKSQLEPDPLEFPHMFEDEKNIEVMGFISSLFAYGNVTQIINTLHKIIKIMNYHPYEFVMQLNIKSDITKLGGLKHRFYTDRDIIRLFDLIQRAYNENSSLKNLFLNGFNHNDESVKEGIRNLSNFFLNSYRIKYGKIPNSIKFMFPLPEKGSACKRMNLFLRWMVRRDELDFGLWNEIPKNKLIIPVDTHIAKICKQLKLTKRKNVSWKMAEEITENLKKFDPLDPVKYDFALCHIGMRRMSF